MSDIYRILAPHYDEWNGELDYAAWADGMEKRFSADFPGRVEAVLDLGCGSGRMTLELARRGYDMIGVDLCPEMLAEGQRTAEAAGLSERILWLMQDMRAFELYGTVEAVVCCLDGLNHLTSTADLRATLRLVRNYLVPGGLFLFDLNSRYKFERIYADNSYTFESENCYCVWQNDYHPSTHTVDFYVTLFEEEPDGRYRRYDERTRERMYTPRAIKRILAEEGFALLSVGGAPYTDTAADEDERLYYVARSEKRA